PTLYYRVHHPALTPFPTRRSSDLRHRTKRSGQEVQLETRDHQVPAGVGELLQQINDGLFKELSFVDADHARVRAQLVTQVLDEADRKSTRLNSSHVKISYAVFCLK